MSLDDVAVGDRAVTPQSIYDDNIESIARKADKYRGWSRFCTVSIAATGAFIPLFVGVFDGWLLTKLIPSALAAMSVMLASFVQLEKPQERWVLYRRAHRRLQKEWNLYSTRIGPYSDSAVRDEVFLVAMQAVFDDLHKEWEGLVPDAGETAGFATGRRAATPRRKTERRQP